MFRSRIAFAALLICVLVSAASAQTPSARPVPCDQDPTYHKLDFWLGEWDVFDLKSGEKDGTNRIEKTLKGCAILESWTEASDHSEGKSVFYVERATSTWKQVWIEDSGGTKEKRLLDSYVGECVRFQGEIPHKDGSSHLDRTTLQPLTNNRVRQTIEISRDGGKSWTTVYDAEYRPKK